MKQRIFYDSLPKGIDYISFEHRGVQVLIFNDEGEIVYTKELTLSDKKGITL